jgi:hypothetical protein
MKESGKCFVVCPDGVFLTGIIVNWKRPGIFNVDNLVTVGGKPKILKIPSVLSEKVCECADYVEYGTPFSKDGVS